MIIIDGAEYWTAADCGAYYGIAPQQHYLRQRQKPGHPRGTLLIGHSNAMHWPAAELLEWTRDQMVNHPELKSLFATPALAIFRGMVPGAVLTPEGEASVRALLAKWLDAHGGGRRVVMQEFMARLEKAPVDA